ncbi:MAG TPA: DNA-processing protein DprA, partial [Chloroflexota bacterium]|nr:DNA-processing protein DprA [Chloroflexota bacterium]
MFGLADVVVVVESHASGGSLHTVESALERGRPVMAVPGPVRSSASAGTND